MLAGTKRVPPPLDLLSKCMATRRLTDRQTAVLAALERLGRATLLDLSGQFPELSSSALGSVLEALERRGLVASAGDPGLIYVGGVEWWARSRSHPEPTDSVRSLADALSDGSPLTTYVDAERDQAVVLLPLESITELLVPSDPSGSARAKSAIGLLRAQLADLSAQGRVREVAIAPTVTLDEGFASLEIRVAPTLSSPPKDPDHRQSRPRRRSTLLSGKRAEGFREPALWGGREGLVGQPRRERATPGRSRRARSRNAGSTSTWRTRTGAMRGPAIQASRSPSTSRRTPTSVTLRRRYARGWKRRSWTALEHRRGGRAAGEHRDACRRSRRHRTFAELDPHLGPARQAHSAGSTRRAGGGSAREGREGSPGEAH